MFKSYDFKEEKSSQEKFKRTKKNYKQVEKENQREKIDVNVKNTRLN